LRAGVRLLDSSVVDDRQTEDMPVGIKSVPPLRGMRPFFGYLEQEKQNINVRCYR